MNLLCRFGLHKWENDKETGDLGAVLYEYSYCTRDTCWTNLNGTYHGSFFKRLHFLNDYIFYGE